MMEIKKMDENTEESLNIKDLNFKKIEISKRNDKIIDITIDGKMAYTLIDKVFDPPKVNFIKLIEQECIYVQNNKTII